MKKLAESFYVDDVVRGAKNEETAFTLYSQAKALLKEGGFNLISNCDSLRERVELGC